jgi:ATP-dependent Clp protease ATP-binding subunit ClpA
MSPFENFTDRAYEIVTLASAEAERQGQSADTVHVLLGMIAEGKGIAGNVLARHNVDAEKISEAYDSVRRESEVSFDDVASRSEIEARWFGHRYPGTEHLLLALCGLTNSRAARLLENLGHQPVQFCHDVVDVLGHSFEWDRWLTDHPDVVQDG